MDDHEIVRKRDHYLAPDRIEMTEELARDYPLREQEIRSDWNSAKRDQDVNIRVGGDSQHVVIDDDAYGLRVHGWNERLAFEQLLRARYEIDYDMSGEMTPEEIRERVDVYHPPAWETQVLEQAEGEYTDEVMLTHFEQVSQLIPVEWFGLSADDEIVYCRYRGGTLKVKVGNPGHQRLAFQKQVARFPDASMTTRELFRHLPPWIGHVSQLDTLPDETRDRIRESMREMHDQPRNDELNQEEFIDSS